MDANEILKEVESLEGDKKVEFLTTKVKELVTSSSELENSLEYEKSEAKKAFEARDDFKAKHRELENKIASGNTETQELMKAKDEKIDSLTSQLDELRGEKDLLSKKVESVETDRRNEILESVPEDYREPLKDIKDLGLLSKNAKQINDIINAGKGRTFNPKAGKLNFTLDEKTTWDNLSMKQREELKEKEPAKYEQLKKTKFNKR